MKITQISINGFGKFHDISFDLSGPMTCFYGYNEAGKSTLMGFIRSLLFGFPTRTNRRERYEPLQGGMHGGSITLMNEQGEPFRIERYAMNGPSSRRVHPSGGVTLIFPDGTTGGATELQKLLGGLTGDVFRNLFAFSLSELQEMSSLQSDEISEYLFNAGVGAGAATILEAEKQIKHEMDQYYRPKGRKQHIQQLLKTMDETQIKLLSYKESVTQYQLRSEEMEQNKAHIEQLEAKWKEANQQVNWLEKCIQSRERWIQLVQLQTELAELPKFNSFPEDALHRFKELSSEQDRLKVVLGQKLKKISELTETRDHIDLDEELLMKEQPLQSMMEQMSAYQTAINDTVDLRHEIQSMMDELERFIRKINHHWTEADLREFSTSISEQEKVHQFREQFEWCQKRIAQWQQEQDRVIKEQEIERQSIDQLQHSLRKLKHNRQQQYRWMKLTDSSQIRSFLTKLRSEVECVKQLQNNIQQHQHRIEDLKQTSQTFAQLHAKRAKSPYIQRFIFWIALGMNLGIPLILFMDQQWLLSAISFVMLTTMNGFLFFTTRTQSNPLMRNVMKQHEQKIAELQQNIKHLNEQLQRKQQAIVHEWFKMIDPQEAAATSTSAEAFGRLLSEEISDFATFLSHVDEIFAQLENIMEELKQNEMQQIQIEHRCSEHEQSIQLLVEVKKKTELELQKASEQYDQLRSEWNAWLLACNLKQDLSVEAVTEIFRIAEQSFQLLTRKEKIDAKLRSRLNWIAEFELKARNLLQLSEEAHVETSIRQYHQELDEQRKRMVEKLNLEKQISELQEECESIRAALDQVTDKIYKLWHEAHADGEEQFRMHARFHSRRLELENEIRQTETVLATWVGSDQRQRLDKTLQEKNHDQLQEAIEWYTSQMEEWKEQIDLLRERNGKLQNELEQMKSGDDYSALLQEQQEQISSFHEWTGQWAARAICLKLFQKAKEIYERDKQPGVLKKASEYFALITNQQFTRVIAPIGEKRIMVERATGEWLDSAFMSRGTAEQLYLAMRFALAEEYAAKISLPIMMDDIFVNFDFPRLQNTFKLLKAVSERQQIIVFTCHDHVYDALKMTIPELQSINLHST